MIPITADQDTAGPMARTVSDVAIMFGALESATPDPNDPATRLCTPPAGRDYTKFLKREGLKGARIGIPRAFFFDRLPPSGDGGDSGRGGRGADAAPAAPGGGGGRGNTGGLNDPQKKAMDEAIAVLKREGAVIVDPADIPSVVDKDAANNFVKWGQCSGANNGKGHDEDCSVVVQVRHEARLQHVARVARAGRAGEDRSVS